MPTEEEQIREIEDKIDIKEALKVLKDPRNISWERVKKELGL
jgi:hypothetical protein